MGGFTGKEAVELSRACTLNLSSCRLNLKQYQECVELCDEIMAGEGAGGGQVG